jgi:type II secretory pathway pseudopilin PulG
MHCSLSKKRPLARATTRRRRAFTLIEVIISVGILSLAILTLIGLFGAVFRQIEDVVRLNRAINVVKAIDAALSNPKIIGGEDIKNLTDSQSAKGATPPIPPFDALFTHFVEKSGKSSLQGAENKCQFFYFELSYLNDDIKKDENDETGVMSFIYNNDNKPRLTLPDTAKSRLIGHAFRIEISVGRTMLKGLKLRLGGNEDDPVPYGEIYDGASKLDDIKPDQFSLSFLPLFIEVYPWNPHGTEDPSKEITRPIFRQNIILNR